MVSALSVARRRATGARGAIRPALLLFLAVVVATPAGAVAGSVTLESTAGVVVAPGPPVLTPGDASLGWVLLDGFYPPSALRAGRSAVWTRGEAALVLPLGEPIPAGSKTELALRLRPVRPGQSVTLELDGGALGTRTLARGFQTATWPLPEEGVEAGPHLLRLRVSETHRADTDSRLLGVLLVRVQTTQAAGTSEPAGHRSARRDAGRPPRNRPDEQVVRLPKGRLFALEVPAAPASRIRIEATGDGARLDAWLVTADGVLPAEGELPVRPGGGGSTALFDGGWTRPGVLVLQAVGAPLRLGSVAIEGTPGPLGQRLACRVVLPETLLFLTGVALLGALLVASRRLRGGRGVAIEVTLVMLLAFALRALFLAVYPEPGASPDTWEYLMRSRLLADGAVPFLGSTRWHAWQTWVRPPGFYLFLAGLDHLPGVVEVWASWSHALFSALTAGALYATGFALFGRRAGLAAGALFALYAESIVTFSRVLTEPLYLVLLVPALAALAFASKAPSWRWAAAAGLLFGLAAHVRSAPVFFVPVAALALLWVHGRRHGWKPAAALVVALVVTVVPWSLRNSVLRGAPMGMDDLTVINLLQSWPDEEIVPTHGADLGQQREYRRYYYRLKGGNRDGELTARSGEIVTRALGRMVAHPGQTVAHFGQNVGRFFGLYHPEFVDRTFDDERLCRGLLVVDLMNGSLVALLILAGAGLALVARRRVVWPVMTWFLFNFLAMTVIFHAEPRYRLGVLPVAFVLAGAALSHLGPRAPRTAPAADGSNGGPGLGSRETAER